MRKKIILLDAKGHLNDMGILLYVDALRLDREKDLPESLVNHVSECVQCKSQVIEYYQFKQDDKLSELDGHPYFDDLSNVQEGKQFFLSASLKNILTIAAMLIGFLCSFYIIYQLNSPQISSITAHINFDSLYKDLEKTKVNQIREEISENNPTSDSITKEQSVVPREKEKIPAVEESVPVNPIEKKILSGTSSNTKKSPDNLLSLHIRHWDKLIEKEHKGNYRSSENIEILYPKLDSIYKTSVNFQWDSSLQDTLTLEIFTKESYDKEEKPLVFKIAPKVTSFQLPLSVTDSTMHSLEKGLYYWKLFQEIQQTGRRKRIGVGRFRVD